MTKWVSSSVLAGAPVLVSKLGGDCAAMFLEAGLPPEALTSPSTPVEVSAFTRFLAMAADRLNCVSFGVLLAQYQEFTLFGPLAPLFGSAMTIGELIDDLALFFPLHTQGAVIGLVPFPDGMELRYDLAAKSGFAHRQIAELGFAVLIKEIRRHLPNWSPEYITFRHAAPAVGRDHQRFLGRTVEFNSDRNAVFFTREELGKPTREGSAQLHNDLVERYRGLRNTTPGTLAAAVESLVRAFMPHSTIDLPRAASLLRMSRRSLQRKLAEDGTSLMQIVDNVRADLALSYLHDSRLTVTQIGEILQFSETSAFTRAVTRWYGQSPRQLR